MDWVETTTRRDEKHLIFVPYITGLMVFYTLVVKAVLKYDQKVLPKARKAFIRPLVHIVRKDRMNFI